MKAWEKGLQCCTRSFYVDSELTDGAIHYYVIRACNSAGEGPSSNSANGTTYALPDAPSNPSAEISSDAITLSWNAPVNDGGSPITSYRIYRSVLNGASQMLAEPSDAVWQDRQAARGIEYTYAITAVNCVGESPAITTTATLPGIPPNAPTALSAKVSGSQISLTWKAPENNGAGELVGYTIYRGTTVGSEMAYDDLDMDAGTNYNDTNVIVGVTYNYMVAAIGLFGEGARSSAVSEIISPSLPAVPTNSTNKTEATISETAVPRAQDGIQGSLLFGTGMVAVVALITAGMFITRSGFGRKKGIADPAPDQGHPAEMRAASTDQSSIEPVALETVDSPTTPQQKAPVQSERDAIDVEFEKALEELAAMQRY